MLYAEQWGIDQDLLPSLASLSATEGLHLVASNINASLQFACRKGPGGTEIRLLQSGTDQGLLSYLFAK